MNRHEIKEFDDTGGINQFIAPVAKTPHGMLPEGFGGQCPIGIHDHGVVVHNPGEGGLFGGEARKLLPGGLQDFFAQLVQAIAVLIKGQSVSPKLVGSNFGIFSGWSCIGKIVRRSPPFLPNLHIAISSGGYRKNTKRWVLLDVKLLEKAIILSSGDRILHLSDIGRVPYFFVIFMHFNSIFLSIKLISIIFFLMSY